MVLQLSQHLFRRRLTRAVVLPLVLLLLLAGISIGQITRLLAALRWVDHTDQVISQANVAQKLLLDLETGLRGYLLTGQQNFLEPYAQASATVDSSLQQLQNLVSDNPIQEQRANALMVQAQQLKAQVQPTLRRRQRGQPEPIRELEHQKQSMDRIRQEIATFIATEVQLRNQRSQTAQQTTQSVVLTSLLLAFGVGAVLAFFLRRQILQVSLTYQGALHTAQLRTEEMEQAAIALQRSAQRLAALRDIDRAILASETNQTLMGNALTQLRQVVPHQQAFVAVFDPEAGTAQVVAGNSQIGALTPPVAETLTIADFAPEQGLLRGIHYTQNLSTMPVDPPLLRQLGAHGFCSCLRVPLRVENTLIGELNLASTEQAAFNEEAQDIAREVAAQLAIALQQTRLRTQLQEYATQLEQRVTERTAQLEETNRELEAFTYSVSHDLRAPLRTIQGFANALLEDCGETIEDDCRNYVNSILDDAVQMNRLISDLLDYSRLTHTQINLQPTDLDEVVAAALKQLTASIQEQQVQLRVASPLPHVIAHPSTLVQVIANLISNAIKFMAPGTHPQIDIFATHERQDNQGWMRLWIVDNGIGIAPEHQDRIFRVFERLHGAERYPGTGIGLAIVRKGLDRMGGRVGVESQLGQGSRFWIALPTVALFGSAQTDDPSPASVGN